MAHSHSPFSPLSRSTTGTICSCRERTSGRWAVEKKAAGRPHRLLSIVSSNLIMSRRFNRSPSSEDGMTSNTCVAKHVRLSGPGSPIFVRV